MSIEEARAALRAKLEEKLVVAKVNEAMAAARPALLLQPEAPGTEAPIGCSKVGGAPDLPEGFAWPMLRRPVQPRRSLFSWGKRPDTGPSERDAPLLFVAQIDLAACPVESELDIPLPKSGLLSFFYFYEKRDWISEFAPGLAGGSLLVWHPASTTLVRRPPPEGLNVFPELRLMPKPVMTFAYGIGYGRKNWSDQEIEIIGTWNEAEPEGVRLGGYASPVQDPMEPECEAGMRRLAGEPFVIDWERHKDETWDWKLILEIESLQAAKMNWVSAGSLYVWMREADIRDGKFENAGTIMQFS